ncbi:MAG: o-succinylbenzoate--CoA ligase [Armatimonadota bacterium]
MTDWLRARARLAPDRLAVRTPTVHLSFGDLDRRAEGTARKLAALGVHAGTRVALLLRNGADFAVLTHALPRLGAVMVPLNVRLAAPELAWQLGDSRAALLISEPALALQAAAAAHNRADVRSLDTEDLHGAPEADVPLRDRVDLAAVQGIIYTSATTGRPKGVMLTFGNHWWNAIGSALHLGLHDDDRWLDILPLYHVGGLAILWRSVIYGVPVVIPESFDPHAANREIDEGRVTLVSVVSTMLQRMLDARAHRPYPPSLRCILLGGGPAPRDLIETCTRLGVPVAPTYGLTEAASQVATLHPSDLARKPGSAGRALFPTEVRIEAGEILVRGPSVMAGYADRPEETALALRDGWLHTGDLGIVDDDGYLYVQDRRDDLIVTGGENVYPSEVEAVLREYPAIEDAGVVGVPDPAWGQVVAAAVVARPGARVGEDDVKAFCQARLARFKVPARLWVVGALPRSPGGKVLRRMVREQVIARDGSRGHEPILSAAPAIRRAWVRDAFHAIAGRYDLLNHVLSGGIHVLWKRAAVRAAGLRPGDTALDVCCGTGDMLLGLARAVGRSGHAIGIDFAPGMLAGAARRLDRKRPGAHVGLICADAEALPLPAESLDGATFAFGLRNVARPPRALAEVYRVLRPRGRLVVLEFGQPRSTVLRALYDLYSRTIIPLLGGWLSGRRDAYQYLHDSIRRWTDPPALAALMRQAGFEEVRYRPVTGGIAVLHVAVKGNNEGGAR